MLDNHTSKVDYANKRRLAKIHKLKQENRMLGQKRSSYLKSFEMQGYTKDDGTFWITKNFRHFYLEDVLYLNKLSEKIGKNSAKIMRLRTLIQQSKIV
jgi:hypothetical protein